MVFGLVSLLFLTTNYSFTYKQVTITYAQLAIAIIYLVSVGMGIFTGFRKDYVFSAGEDAFIYGFILFYTIISVMFNVMHGRLPLPF